MPAEEVTSRGADEGEFVDARAAADAATGLEPGTAGEQAGALFGRRS